MWPFSSFSWYRNDPVIFLKFFLHKTCLTARSLKTLNDKNHQASSQKFRQQTPEEGRRTYRPKRCGNNHNLEESLALDWFLSLMVYQIVWVIKCQSRPYRKAAVILCNSKLRIISVSIPFLKILDKKEFSLLLWLMAYKPLWVI